MENGTQGWVLSGMVLDEGKDSGLPQVPGDISERRASAAALAERHGVERVSASALSFRRAKHLRSSEDRSGSVILGLRDAGQDAVHLRDEVIHLHLGIAAALLALV